MIPLRDDVPSRTFPVVNVVLIGVNALFFLLELGLGSDLGRFLAQTAVVPLLYARPDGTMSLSDVLLTSLDPDLGGRVLLSMFLHGGWAHILGNMLYLWIFGDNVEDRMGHGRYIAFYLICGWVATYAHVLSDPSSRMPSIGASGAIAGVLGGYILLYPRARVITMLPIFFYPLLIQIPAYLLLGLWFLQQFISGSLALAVTTAQTGGIAWWAHVGGFLTGAALVGLLQKPQRRPPSRDVWWEDAVP